MSVLARLNRLVRSNLNDLSSRAARRDVVSQVREGLDEARAQQVQTRIAERRLATEYERLLDECAAWEHRAELALRKGDEPLARQALLRKNRNDRRAEAVKKQLDTERSHLVDLDRTLQAVELKIGGLRDRGIGQAPRPAASPRASMAEPPLSEQRAAEWQARAELGLADEADLLGKPELFDAFDDMSARLADSAVEIDALRALGATEAVEAPTGDLEARFRRLEADDDLDALRDRASGMDALRQRLDEE